MDDEIVIKNSDVKILLVDNMTHEIKYLRILLEQHSYQVYILSGNAFTLEQIKKNKPDIIISDVLMPEINGYDFCWQVKNDCDLKDIPVILLTQVSGPNDIIKGLESGADNFILKPYNNRQLLTRLQDIILSKELRKRNHFNDKLDILFLGKNYTITSNKAQVLDLLFSVLENAIKKNEELEYVNDRLMAALDNIRNLDQLKNDFISSVSHEIRTPLTSISGALRLVQGGITGKVSEKAKNLLEIAIRNSNRLMLLLNDILDIQKIESGKMVFKFQHYNLLSLVKQAIEINSALTEKYNTKIQLQTNNIDCIVNVDPDRLLQVFTNLLSNATKFSPDNGVVTVRVRVKKLSVRVSVIDEGPGIPDKFRATIYDRFSQTTATSHKQKEGTGLGLYITKNIVEKLNGKIDFKSRPGQGTTFFIELPKITN